MTDNFTENGEENDDAGYRVVGGRHGGVSVIVGGRLSVVGAIQRLEVGNYGFIG